MRCGHHKKETLTAQLQHNQLYHHSQQKDKKDNKQLLQRLLLQQLP